jgi:hypothetical protein
MNLYENFKCSKKTLFIPQNIETLFINYGNRALYKKQRIFLKPNYSKDAGFVIKLIKKHKKVLEQEII